MKYSFSSPSDSCHPLVFQYQHIQADNGNIPVIDRHISNGYASLVFNPSGQVAIHEERIITLPTHFIVVPLFRAIKIAVFGDIDSFIVTCQAPVLSKLLSLNFNILESGYYCLSESYDLKLIVNQYVQCKSEKERIDIIEHFFIDKGLINYAEDEIDLLYNEIMNGRGCKPIAEHIEQFDKSPRYFREHFIKRVGVNAKTLARIVRVNHLWSMILENSAIDFQDMVFEGNYFDQAHLIHDFKKIVGENPSVFFRRNLDNVKIISGKR